MCYKELWQKQKAEKEKKWIDNHKGADVAWCSQRHPHESWYHLMHTSAGPENIITPLI